MTDSIRRMVMGSLLILLGIAFLLKNVGIITFEFRGVWPWLLVIPGLIFWGVAVMNRAHYRLVLPGTILLGYGLLFLGAYSFHLGEMHTLWPVFILVPGLGFLAVYFLGPRESSHLRTGSFLTVLAIAFFVLEANPDLFWPVLLIGIGVLMLVHGLRERRQLNAKTESTTEPSDTTES